MLTPQMAYLDGAPVVATADWADPPGTFKVWEGNFLSAPLTAQEVCERTGPQPPIGYAPSVLANTEYGEVRGLAADTSGNLYVLAFEQEGNLNWKEPALYARCVGEPWKVERLDRTHMEIEYGNLLMSDGRIVWPYNWGVLVNKTNPGAHLNYVTVPEDSVMLATRLACPN